MGEQTETATTSPDPLGDLTEVFRREYGAMNDPAGVGLRLRRAVAAVERQVNARWLDMLPPGALMCGCGDIVQTDHQCANCDTADWAVGDGKGGA